MLQTWLLKIQTYLFRKPKFKTWANLEDKKYDTIQAVESNSEEFPQRVIDYLSTALLFPVNHKKIYWKDTIEAFYKIHSVTSTIRKIPITSTQAINKDTKDVWDYSGRLYYLYLNIIASAYGWTEKEIAQLDVDDALAYLQEILTERQLDKEFIWQTTEIAYPYDSSTKKSKFVPLERPYWMVKEKEHKKAPPMPKSLLPMGNVIRINEAKKT